MKTQNLTMISLAALAIVISVYVFLLIQNQPIRPQVCSGSESTDCIYDFPMWMDNKNRDYNAFPIINETNKPVEFDGVKFIYTGSNTPEADGINCDNVFPRAINSTTGHHPPVIVNYDGYFHVNETRHFTAAFANGKTESLVLCWNDGVHPKVIQMTDSAGSSGPMLCPQKTSWFDSNKTAGIIQDEYCSLNSPAHDRYIAEIGK